MARLIRIAEKPRVTIKSLKKGNEITVPGVPAGGFPASIFEKSTNNKKQMLQIKVNLEKKEISFIKKGCFEKLSTK